jgi:hypothetical protein
MALGACAACPFPSRCTVAYRGCALRSHSHYRRVHHHGADSVAFLGGILAVIITARPFSVLATVAFISIFGITVIDDVLLSFYIRALRDQGHPFLESTILSTGRRVTRHVDDGRRGWVGGLLPAAISTKIGSRKPNDRWRLSQCGRVAIALLTRCFSRFDLSAPSGLAARRQSYSTAGRNLSRGLQIVG